MNRFPPLASQEEIESDRGAPAAPLILVIGAVLTLAASVWWLA